MSKFFKALEQAERDQALRGQQAAGSRQPAECQGQRAESIGQRAEHQPPDPEPSAPCTLPYAPGPLPTTVDPHLVSLLSPTSYEAEQYLTLRHMVERWHKDAGLSRIAVSSPTRGDGKTITAINLAGALSQAPEARILLVDADLRAPSVSRYLGLSDSSDPGLVEAILDPSISLEAVVRPCPPFNLDLVPAGRPPASPYEVLKSPRLGELLEEARGRYDSIVLDLPPLLPFPDCRLIAKWIDGLLIITAAHKTPRKLVEEALAVIDPAKVLGLVFNGDHPASRYYPYYYYGSSNGNWIGQLGRALRAKR